MAAQLDAVPSQQARRGCRIVRGLALLHHKGSREIAPAISSEYHRCSDTAVGISGHVTADGYQRYGEAYRLTIRKPEGDESAPFIMSGEIRRQRCGDRAYNISRCSGQKSRIANL